jgi:predicted TIM-barrel fold metal-dependent hydrolase
MRPRGEPIIYNCHIHLLTTRHVPRHFLKMAMPRLFAFVGIIGSELLRIPFFAWIFLTFKLYRLFSFISIVISEALKFVPFYTVLAKFYGWPDPSSRNDTFERQASFLKIAQSTQEDIFKEIRDRYPQDAVFVVLPMEMTFMNLGKPDEDIDTQHTNLFKFAQESNGQIIPFYAVDPRRTDKDIVQLADENLGKDRFRGLKIYPNMGYRPDDPVLMKIYAICQERSLPVMTHCSYTGTWQYGLSVKQRMEFSHPRNYRPILEKYPKLRVCLGHFGGGEEWAQHLKKEVPPAREDAHWVRYIAEMIRSGEYPNLYTDISYTLFSSPPNDLGFDYFDYLKVLMADKKIYEHVLFGSDYYMVKREKLTEKAVSILLRSRLGEDAYFQIAHHNPMEYLGIKSNITRPTRTPLGSRRARSAPVG